MPERKTGFTLLELLIVIALMMVLAGLLIPAFFKVQNEGRRRQAQVEARIIESAIQAYKMRMRKFPAPSSHLRGGVDVIYDSLDETPDNRLVMELLVDASPPVLEADRVRWDDDGNAINPWGWQYRIWLDLNYDGWLDGENREFRVDWDIQ